MAGIAEQPTSLPAMTADSRTSVRELDCRSTNGIQIRLLWCQLDGRVSVEVMDTRSRESFCYDLAAGERPLDVFYHPFAYATHQHLHRDIDDGLEVASGPGRPENESGARP